MIFLFDKFKKLKGTVRNRHTISLLYERERNGLYTVSAEIPLKITDKKTVYNYSKKVKDSDFLGHYDREGRFQLHKIASVDIEDSSIFIKGVHLFFDEAKAGAIIQERRFRDSEIVVGARVAFDAIGWSVVDADVSDTADYIFYNVSPLEARAILVETFGYEFDYWLDFDGKNIRNKQISIKREMGKDSNKRYNYGHNVLNIKVEQDYSEIYTAVIGRGKGEDLGDDAYGRRIEYTDVEWKTPTHPMNKPKGSRVLHDENATQLFGYHEDGKVSPRTKVEIFEDIEDPAELLRASYNWLKENSVPKAVFSLKVPDGDGLDLGDKVHVIYRDIDLVKHTRVTKVVDDLVSGNRDVEFGDTAYFKTDRRLSGVKSELKRVGGSMSSAISRLKAEFDRRFDNEVQQWKDDFEQAVIDAEAGVESLRAEMTEEFEAAQKEFEEEFNQSVADAKKHAEDTAEAKAKQVQDNLDTFKGEHEYLVGELQGNIVDIDGELAEARADVSEIVGRLTVVDGSISGIEGSLSEIEGTLSNTKTQLESQISDARADLEKSISDTRNALENKIDTTEEALNKVGEDLGNAKTDLQNQLDDARAELEGLEVGGRNLLPNKWEIGSVNGTPTSGANYRDDTTYRSSYVPVTNLDLILNIQSTDENIGRIETWIHGYDEEKNGITVLGTWRDILPRKLEIDESVKFLRVLFRPYDLDGMRVLADLDEINKSIFPKLEKGNIATDWTPAPEDTEQKITNINQTITIIEGELSTKVEQTEVDTLKGTVTAQGTLLTQTADEVSSKAEKSVVDTLTGRVTNAESSVTQNASEIAKKLTKSVYDSDKKATDAKITQWSNTATETAEGLTRVIGRVSETEKGVETAQTRIEAEAGRIDGVLSRTSNVEGKVQDAELAIKANADGLALRATKTEVEQAIDGIEIGGRNYLTVPKDGNYDNAYRSLRIVDGVMYWTQKSSATAGYVINSYAPDTVGTYTFSFKTDNEENIRRFVNNPKSGTRTATLNVSEQGENFLVSLTYKNFNPNQSIGFYGGEPFDPLQEVKFWDFKLEKGNKATDWTPAPEDTDASISEVSDRVTTAEAEIAVHAGEISQKASQTELNRVTGRVSTAETSIIQNANEIARRLVKSDYDSDKVQTDAEITKWSNLTTETAEGLEQTISRVSTAEGKLSDAELSIKANADSLKLAATKTEVENAIDGIEVGGRNLAFKTAVPQEQTTAAVRLRYDLNNETLRNNIGKDITFSFEAKFNSNKSFNAYIVQLPSDYVVGSTSISGGTTDWKKFIFTGVIGQKAEFTTDAQFTLSTPDYGAIRNLKVELGNKATDWTPAPEDIDASISEVTDRVTTAEAEIVVQAGEISQKASQSELDRVAGRVSTAETSIKQNSDSLKLTATKTEVGNAIDGIKVGGRNLLLNSNVQYETSVYNIADYTLSEAIEEGTELTISIKGQLNSKKSYFGVYNSGGSVQTATLRPESQNSDGVYVGTFKWRAGSTSNTFLRVYHMPNSVTGAVSKIDWVKLEYGNKATDWSPAPEDTDAKINDISKDYVKQSSVKVTSDRVTIGSTVVNGSTIGSVLSVSPSGIDAVADAMRLSGDLYVDGDITSLAVNAIEGNFSRLFASSLTTNVIKSSHVQTDTAFAKKLFATNANINELTTRTHFSNSIKTMSIDAVHADLRSVNSEIMTSNIIKSEWLNVDNAIVNRIISRQFFTDNAVIKAANIRDLTATDIKGGVLSSLNNSMKFNLISNHLEFNNDATIDFYSTNNAFRMFTDSSTSDPRDIIHALGTGMSRSGYGQMFLGGGHYDIDGTVKANDIGFAGLKLAGNSASVAGSKVTIGSGGNDSQDQFFEFDFTTSLSNRYAYFKPSKSSDNFVIGTNTERFHSMYTWRLNGLRFYNPAGNVKMGYDNGSGTGASWRFYEDDIWFDRGGTWSMKQIISRANDAHNRINADNGILKQLQNLAGRVSALERK